MDIKLRRPPKQQRSRGRVDEILAAARKLIGEKGIDAVKMREIAALAGGPISSVYQYFPNKTAILATLFEQWSDEVDLRVKDRLDQVDSLDALMVGASDMVDYLYHLISEDTASLDLLNAVQADKSLSDLDLETSRRQAAWFCAVGERYIPESRHEEFRRATFLTFHLSFAAVRLALWERPRQAQVLDDFKSLIRRQLEDFQQPAG